MSPGSLPEQADPYGAGLSSDPHLNVGLPKWTRVSRAVKTEVDYEIRCVGMVTIRTRQEKKKCGKLLAEMAGRPWQIRCARCGLINRSAPPGQGPRPDK